MDIIFNDREVTLEKNYKQQH